MARETSHVPFGYEPEDDRQGLRGTLFVYDSFEDYEEQHLSRLLAFAELKEVKRAVFYPLHEETLKRMGVRFPEPFYKRTDQLEEQLDSLAPALDITIDRFEGRRKKYTPLDTALRFLVEKYKGPHFVAVTAETANKLAAFDSFEHWIKKVRLWIDMKQPGLTAQEGELHPRLRAFKHRWDAIP